MPAGDNLSLWFDAVKTLATLATLGVAFSALRNWQRQDKAKREAEFLDALIEAVHSFIIGMGRPISIVEMSRIGMKSHTSSWDAEDDAVSVARGAISYIKKDGARDAARLLDALNEVRPRAIQLRSLSTKGQVFGFRDYAKCQNAVDKLAWQFERIEAFASIVGWPSANWANEEVKRALDNVLTVEPQAIKTSLAEDNVVVLEYARVTYARLYGVSRRGA